MTSSPSHPPSRVHTALGFGAVLIWSGCSSLARVSAESFGPWATLVLVHTVGFIFVCGLALARKEFRPPLRWPSRRTLLLVALFVAYILFVYGFFGLAANRTQVVVASLLNLLWPSLTLWGSILIFRLSFRPVFLVGQALAFAGAVCAVSPGFTAEPGSAVWVGAAWPLGLGFASGFIWATYTNLSRKWPEASRGIMPFNMLAAAGAASLLCRGELAGAVVRVVEVPQVLVLGLATNLAFVLWDLGIKRGHATLVTLSAYFAPVLTTLVMWFFLGSPLTWTLILAALLISAGALICRFSLCDPAPM